MTTTAGVCEDSCRLKGRIVGVERWKRGGACGQGCRFLNSIQRGYPVTIIDALVGEHAVLFSMLDAIERTAEAAKSLDELKAVGSYFRLVLQQHAEIEDELLFECLGTADEMLSSLHREHAAIALFHGQFVRTSTIQEARDALIQWVRLIRGHFVREETHLLPMAVKVLEPDALEVAGQEWASRRKVCPPGPPGTPIGAVSHPQKDIA